MTPEHRLESCRGPCAEAGEPPVASHSLQNQSPPCTRIALSVCLSIRFASQLKRETDSVTGRRRVSHSSPSSVVQRLGAGRTA